VSGLNKVNVAGVKATAPSPQKPLLSVAEAARHLGWGLSKTYQAARRGDLPGVVVVNGRLHVRAAVLLRWLDGGDHESDARRAGEAPASRASGAHDALRVPPARRGG
jgi:hypothetical protein